jgi:hypothetical protein
MRLDEPVEYVSGYPFLLHKILHLLFPSGANSLCTTPWESGKKKNINMVLMRHVRNFSFFGWGHASPTHSELSLYFVVIGRTPGLISRNNAVKKLSASAIAIMSWQDVTRSSLCSGVKQCATKRAPNFLSQILFQNPKNYCLVDVQRFCCHSWCDLTVIFDQISNSSNVYLGSSRFWPATSLVFIYQLPSMSK